MQRGVADVFDPVRLRIAPENVAGLQLGLDHSSIGEVIANLTARDDVRDERRVRVQLLLVAGMEDAFDRAYALVFERHVLHRRVDYGGVHRNDIDHHARSVARE